MLQLSTQCIYTRSDESFHNNKFVFRYFYYIIQYYNQGCPLKESIFTSRKVVSLRFEKPRSSVTF